MSQQQPSNLRTMPESIPELSRHIVMRSVPDAGGYAVTLDCGHTIWNAVDPGKQAYCGACASNFIDRLRAGRQE